MAAMNVDLPRASASRRPEPSRVDHLLIAEMVAPRRARARHRLRRRRAAGAAARRSATSTGAASSSARRGVNACVAHGLAVMQGDADPTSSITRTTPSTTRSCRQTLQATRNRRGTCSRSCCASASAPSSRSRISAIGACALRLMSRGRMPETDEPARALVRHAEHPPLHDQGFPGLCEDRAPRWSAPSRSTPRARSWASNAALLAESVRRAGGVPAVARELRHTRARRPRRTSVMSEMGCGRR